MTDERTTAYLLGELTEREAEQFEEQCFAQDEWPAADLESAEQDLIEAHIRKQLTAEQERLFEENYLTTEARRERVLLARSFLRVVCSKDLPKRTWTERLVAFVNAQPLLPKYAAIGAVLVLSVVLLLWYLRPPSAPRTFAQLTLTNVTSERRAKDVPPAPIPTIKLPLGEDALRVSLTLPASTPPGATYRVQWENVKGRLNDLRIESQDPRSVSVVIPRDELRPGQYTLKLFRTEPGKAEERVGGDYFFNVE